MFAHTQTVRKNKKKDENIKDKQTNKRRNKNPKLKLTSLKCILQWEREKNEIHIDTKTSTKLCLLLHETLFESIDSNAVITVDAIFGIWLRRKLKHFGKIKMNGQQERDLHTFYYLCTHIYRVYSNRKCQLMKLKIQQRRRSNPTEQNIHSQWQVNRFRFLSLSQCEQYNQSKLFGLGGSWRDLGNV